MPFHRNTFLQLQTIESGKRKIQNQAIRYSCARMVEEFLCGNECLNVQAFMTNQKFERFTNRNIVIDDENNWRGL